MMRYGPSGRENPALVDKDNRVRDVSSGLPDIGAEHLVPAQLARPREIGPGERCQRVEAWQAH